MSIGLIMAIVTLLGLLWFFVVVVSPRLSDRRRDSSSEGADSPTLFGDPRSSHSRNSDSGGDDGGGD